MNSLERVGAALQDLPSDRPAVFLNASLYGSRLTGASLEEHYTRADVYAEGQLAVRAAFGPDLLISPFFVAALGEAFGSRWRARPTQAPNVTVFAARSAEEALALELPDVDSQPRLVYLRETIRILVRQCAGQVPVLGVLVGPMDIPPLVIGLEAWLDALLFRPDAARALLERLEPFCVALARAMLDDGATGLALTANLANRFIVPAAVAETLTLPSLRRTLAQIPGPVILHHGGCPLAEQLPGLQGLPGVAAFLLDAGEDVGAARRTLGPGAVLLGNLDGPGLAELSPEAVGEACDRVLAQCRADRQFILATCCADIRLDTPPGCLAAIGAAARRAGRPAP